MTRRIDTKPSPGVSLERRMFLTVPLLAAGSAFVRGSTAEARANGLTFASFAGSCRSLASELLDEHELDADEYLSRLASLGTSLEPGDVPKGKLGAYGGLEPKVEFGPVQRDLPVLVIQWRFEPGAVLPPHSHTPAYVLSLCLEGECRVRHFDVLGKAPALDSTDTFRVRESENRILRPGRSTSLTPARDNIHTFEAGPEGALGIDVNTMLPEKGDWSHLALDDRPVSPRELTFEARWTGKRPG
jgi:PCO_ADO